MLEPGEAGGIEGSPSSEPMSVSTTVLFAAKEAMSREVDADSANRSSLAMTLSSLPVGTTIEDQRAALAAPDRLAALREAGYARDVVDVGTASAELLTRGDEVTLRWWDETGSVYLRGHHVEVGQVLHFRRNRWNDMKRTFAAAVLLMAIALPRHPAAASPFMLGAWGDDEPHLSTGSVYRTSNVTAMWQSAMAVDINCFLRVDGQFGANTRSNARSWQAWRGLTVDGIVGPQTYNSWEGRVYSMNFSVTPAGNRAYDYRRGGLALHDCPGQDTQSDHVGVPVRH